MRKKNRKPPCRKIVLKLPDLDHAKPSVLNSLNSPHSRRSYKFAMEQFITWYWSEPRLALNRTVVLRFRLYLESLGLAAGTVNQRLAAGDDWRMRRRRFRSAQPGTCRRHPPRQGCQSVGHSSRKLAERRSGQAALAKRRRQGPSRHS